MRANRFKRNICTLCAHCFFDFVQYGHLFSSLAVLCPLCKNESWLLMFLYNIEECLRFIYLCVFSLSFFFFNIVLQHRCPVNSLSCLSISHCTTKAALLIQSTFSTGLAAETGCLHLDKNRKYAKQ